MTISSEEISALPAATALTGAEQFMIAQDGETRRLPVGLADSAVTDVVSALAGQHEGWAFTDMNGWTGAAYHTSPTGLVGQVRRVKIPGADFSGLAGAYRIFEPPPPLEADITVIFWAGQSNAVGQDALPVPARTPTTFASMLDIIKPNAWSGSFGSTFTNAVSQEYIFGGTNHQGDTMPLATADALEGLITAMTGQTQAVHGKRVLCVDVGLSSSDVPGFGYGSAHFTKIMAWCTAAKAAAVAIGKSIKLKAIYWAWGAYAYANSLGYTVSKARIESYCGPTGDIANYILPIFGQTGETVLVGFMGSHHHYQHPTDVLTPYVAQAEQALVAADPSRYSHIDGEGIHFLNGTDGGFGGSSTHHHPSEEEVMGGLAAWWLATKIVQPVTGSWNNMIPTWARTGARQLTMTLPSFPAGAYIGFRASGLTPTTAQANHGWFVCDPATPTVEIPCVVPPYPGAVPGTLIFDTTADLPLTPVEVRYGARTSSNLIAGNTVIYFNSPIMVPVKGVSTALYRTMPAMKVQVA